jgi:CRP/FNR family transcriptional regulator, cyclic AMP receptor protein
MAVSLPPSGCGTGPRHRELFRKHRGNTALVSSTRGTRRVSQLNFARFATDYRTFGAGQPIFEEGAPADVMYIVKEGEIDVVVRGTVVETVGPGGTLGEMACIDPCARSATARAKTACHLVPITARRFQFLIQARPEFALELLRVLVCRLRHMDERARAPRDGGRFVPRGQGATAPSTTTSRKRLHLVSHLAAVEP